uniref:Myosin binding protein Ca n=1 Tax=Oreochromis niloticus TaxID=8128 RepID=A0A669DHN5_ORENI
MCCAQITFSCFNSYFSYSLHSTPITDHLPGEGPQLSELTGLFVLRPESVTDITFVAKVDSSNLIKRPVMKWLKGKWLDLGSKAGKHLQFKESYDRNTKIYTYEMSIIKVVDGDAGGYRCEVTSKDKCDSCTFEVSVQGRSGDRHLITLLSSSIRRIHHYYVLSFSGLARSSVHYSFAAQRKEEPEVDVWEILKNAKPCDYEKIAFQYGITDLRGMLKRLKKMKAESKKSDAFLKKLDPAYSVDKGQKIHLTVEVADPDVPVKWFKNGQEIKPSANWQDVPDLEFSFPCISTEHLIIILSRSLSLSLSLTSFLLYPTRIIFPRHPSASRYVFESVGNKRTLTINKCNLSDDAAYECVVGEEKCFTEVFVKEPPITITKLLDDVHTVVGERVEFEVEVSEEGANVIWMKDGVELNRDTAGSKYRLKKDGKRHILIINEATKEDIGTYYVYTNGGESKAELEVEDKELEVLQNIADLTVKASEQAVFKCEVSDEKVTGKWFKDGVEVEASDRIKISHIGRIHKLTINDVKASDAGDYTFVPDGYALSLSAKLNFLEIKIEYVPRQDPPKIFLDTGSSGGKNNITVVAGNKLRLDVQITGEPAPTVCWMKGDQVRKNWLSSFTSHHTRVRYFICSVLSEAEGRVRVESEKNVCSFVIEGAEKADEGQYSITVTNPVGEDKADLFVRVVDVPNPPENVKCTSVGEDSAIITWDPPAFDGGVAVKGYLMERKKIGSPRWTKLNFDVYESTTYEAKKMIEGVLYEMRVFAVNGIGISQPSASSKPFMPIAPTSEPTRLTVHDVTDSTCALKWLPPEKIGAGGIDGYIIEYCKEGSDQWVRANEEPVGNIHYRVKGLPVGEKIKPALEILMYSGLDIMFSNHLGSGKPRPVVTWYKDGVPMEDRTVGTRTSEVDTILFIRSAERVHSGKYTLSVQIENMSDSADIHIQVVEKPGPPIAVHVTDIWGFNAALEWKPPKDDGNCEIIGYTIQKADKKTKEWFTVYEHNRRPSCTVSDLVMGNEYSFRVFSENICGLSDEPVCVLNVFTPCPGLLYNPSPYKEMDVSSCPKFTAPLVDRSVIAGYSAAISCAVRGNPKPKIIWMKNRMILGEDPKFLMQNNQGVLTLNIRKPSLFDGGRYSCRAINDLGEDEVECTLEVRGMSMQFSLPTTM